jgi:hypothetical protein
MAVKGQRAFLASTPRGKNLFFQMAQLGMGDNEQYHYHSMTYRENPFYDLQEIEDAKVTLPDAVFRQEYEAEFVGDEGIVFENLKHCSRINKFITERVRGEKYFAGLDLARQSDYTVLTIMNDKREVVFVYRINKTSWDLITRNIVKWLLVFQPVLFVEVNSIGDVIYENIQKNYKRVVPFITTNNSKQEIVEDLIYEFSQGGIAIPTPDLMPEFYRELEIFSFEYSKKTRTIRYGAPAGFTDDCVISLALANRATKHVARNQMSWSTI